MSTHSSFASHPKTSAPGKPDYYPALDGLRAVAVLMVFLQHYASGQSIVFGWGWTGVDIFFVLSGFLITGILYDSQNEPHRFRDFYARRTLRIFPLYYAVWLVILLSSPAMHWIWNWRWALWPAYVGNYARFLFLHQPGNPFRFDRITCGLAVRRWFGSPMHLYIGHFWSLCVEEQFYLIWPLVVYKVRSRVGLIRICTGVLLVAPLLRWWLAAHASTQMLGMELLYRSLPTRADALLLGGLVALLLRGPHKARLRHFGRWLALAAPVLLAGAYVLLTNVLHWPFAGSVTPWLSIWGFTLIDLIAAGLILEAIRPASYLARLLQIKWLRGLGIISYGFYVYHDLLHDLYGYWGNRFFPAHAFAFTITLAFVCTLLISWLSFRLVEAPMLRLKRRFAHQIHTASAA